MMELKKLKGGHHMHRYICYLTFLFISLSFFIHGNSFSQDDVLAKIGDRTVTIADLNETIGYLDRQRQKNMEQNPQLKESLLRQLVQGIVISDLAKKDGYDKKPEVKEKLEFFTNNILANLYLQNEVAGKISVSEQEINTYYEEHKKEFIKPEMVKARHILIKIDKTASEEEKKKAQEKAQDILMKIKAGEDFAKLATEFSDDTLSATKGGDLGFFTRSRMVPSFEDAAFALKPGEISDIVKTPFGYHIIKVDDRKDAEVEPYDAVKENIKQKLIQERTQSTISEFIDKAVKDAGVEFHLELISGPKQ